MLLKDRLAARIRDNLAWEVLGGADAPSSRDDSPAPVAVWPAIQELWKRPNEEFVHGLYRLLFTRRPFPKEVEFWDRTLRDGTPRAHVVRRIAESEEAKGRGVDVGWLPSLRPYTPEGIWEGLLGLWHKPAGEFVRGVYHLLLRREADPAGLATYLGALADGATRVAVIEALTSSGEFAEAGTDCSWLSRLRLLTPDGLRDRLIDLFGEPDEAFARGLYEAILHRPPTAAELDYHAGALGRGASRPGVVREFLASEEARGRYTGPAWDAALSPLITAQKPAASRPEWVAPVAADTSREKGDWAWVGEPDARAFVRGAYRAFLGREPGPAEVAGQVRKLRLVPFYTRNRLLNSLARSWEAQAWARREAASSRLTAERERRQAAADAGHQAAALAGQLLRLDRRLAELTAAADGRRAAGMLDELYREAQNHRHQLYALLHLTGRVPEGLSDQLHRIEAAIGHPTPSLARIAEGVAGLRAVTDTLVFRSDKFRKLLPRLIAAGRELQTGQQEVRAGQQAVLEGYQQLAVSQQHSFARQEEFAARHRELLSQQRQLADDQVRLADGLSMLAGTQERIAADQGRIADEQQGLRAGFTADRFATGVWFDQLRRVGSAVADHVGARVAVPSGPAADRSTRCRVCDGELSFKWAAGVLGDRYQAEYHECRVCQALQIPDPYWLPEAYKREAEPLLWNPDWGRFRRNFTVFCYLKALAAAGLPATRMLDYGGGYGLLTQMLADAGVDAWAHDPYVPQPYFASDRVVPRLEAAPAGSFDVITAFEVFEHLTAPVPVGAEFRRLLRPGGAVVLSTTLYEPGVHGPDWYYLVRQGGQHVLLWSRTALRVMAARLGFASVGIFPETGFQFIVLADLPAADLTALIGRMKDHLWGEPFLREAAGGWLLARPGDHAQPPDVIPCGPDTGGESCAS